MKGVQKLYSKMYQVKSAENQVEFGWGEGWGFGKGPKNYTQNNLKHVSVLEFLNSNEILKKCCNCPHRDRQPTHQLRLETTRLKTKYGYNIGNAHDISYLIAPGTATVYKTDAIDMHSFPKYRHDSRH